MFKEWVETNSKHYQSLHEYDKAQTYAMWELELWNSAQISDNGKGHVEIPAWDSVTRVPVTYTTNQPLILTVKTLQDDVFTFMNTLDEEYDIKELEELLKAVITQGRMEDRIVGDEIEQAFEIDLNSFAFYSEPGDSLFWETLANRVKEEFPEYSRKGNVRIRSGLELNDKLEELIRIVYDACTKRDLGDWADEWYEKKLEYHQRQLESEIGQGDIRRYFFKHRDEYENTTLVEGYSECGYIDPYDVVILLQDYVKANS